MISKGIGFWLDYLECAIVVVIVVVLCISTLDVDMDSDYAEYQCLSCRKEIKNTVSRCKSCQKAFFHPGCVSKHKVYDKNREMVQCGPFEKFMVDTAKEGEMKRGVAGCRDRLGSTGSTGSVGSAMTPVGKPGSGNKVLDIEGKIDVLVKMICEMKDELAYKEQMKMLIMEVVRSEMESVKGEIEELKRMICKRDDGLIIEGRKKYSGAIGEKEKENIIIVKPKVQQESETTKKILKEKIDIKSMEVGITKLKKGTKGTVVMGYETGEKVEKVRDIIQSKLGKSFEVTESKRLKHKIKIVNVGVEELKLDDNELIATIRRQNGFEERKENILRIEKRIFKGRRRAGEERIVGRGGETGGGAKGGAERRNGGEEIVVESNSYNSYEQGRSSEEGRSTEVGRILVKGMNIERRNVLENREGSLIIEVDEETHEIILGREKINVGWRKCRVFNHVNVKRCFKCWGFHHVAKYCTLYAIDVQGSIRKVYVIQHKKDV